jgi:hypothetical protein
MPSSGPEPRVADRVLVPPRLHRVLVPALLLAAAALGFAEILGDSATVDEVPHLTSAIVHLKTGDVHLTVDHPPLARDYAALPLLFTSVTLPDWTSPAWVACDFGAVGREFFYAKNDGEKLLVQARCMIVALYLLLGVLIYTVAKRLFGSDAALVSLLVVCLCPTFRAHGHLFTTDLPATLTLFLVVVTFARLCQSVTALRLAAACAAFGVASVTKYSWPVLLPVLALMSIVAVLRRQVRPAPVLLFLAAMGATAWVAVWASYGFRYSPFRGPMAEKTRMYLPPAVDRPDPTNQEEAWEAAFHDWRGEPISGLVPSTVRFLREHKVLPESYLFGIMALKRGTNPRLTYFRGEVSYSGTPAYFPTAFALKTPIPTLLVFAAGLAALLARAAPRSRDPLLLTGILSFGVLYFLFAVFTALNIGHRHLLPFYPVVAVVAGAAACWRRPPAARFLAPLLVAWLAVVSLRTFPNDLGYFNELVGGWRGGSWWLADSNVDWGQDFKRLGRWAKAHGDPPLKLVTFGPADPAAYGLKAEFLLSPRRSEKLGTPTAGTYVVSLNELLSIFFIPSRDSYWENPRNRAYYESLFRKWGPLRGGEPSGLVSAESLSWENYRALAAARIVHAFKRRPPDVEIGTSLLVFELSQAEIDGILSP